MDDMFTQGMDFVTEQTDALAAQISSGSGGGEEKTVGLFGLPWWLVLVAAGAVAVIVFTKD